jgi:hypothetical protein
MISKEYLHERFTYVNGELYWKTVNSNRLKVGQLAGDRDGKGYRRIMIGNQHFKMHRLIWIMFNGDIPENLVVDHIDRDLSNNKIENLRLLTKSMNTRNQGKSGVSWDKARKKWRAQASVNDTTIQLGRFDTKEAAEAEYKSFYDFMLERDSASDTVGT